MNNQERRFPSVFVSGLFQIITIVVLFIALLQNILGLIVLSLSIIIIVNGAKLWSKASLSNLLINLEIDNNRAFPDDSLNLYINIENNKLLPVFLKINILLPNLIKSNNESNTISYERGLFWFQKTNIERSFTPLKRGCYNIGPTTICTGDLLGFFNIKKKLKNSQEIIVYPRIKAVDNLSQNLREYFGKIMTENFIEDPININGTKAYQQSTPAKHIHWKASARYSVLQEKVFQATSNMKVLLFIDISEYNQCIEESYEDLFEWVAAYALEFNKIGVPVGLAVNGMLKANFLNIGQMDQILEALARIKLKEEGEKAFRNIDNNFNLPRGTVCMYFYHNKAKNNLDFFKDYITKELKIPIFKVIRIGELDTEEGF